MNRKTLATAVAEAKRFLAAAKSLPDAVPYERHGHQFTHDSFPKEQGAIRRASMDLNTWHELLIGSKPAWGRYSAAPNIWRTR